MWKAPAVILAILVVGGLLDSETDPAWIANLGLLEFVADLARWGKLSNSNTAVNIKQPPSREAETIPFFLGEALPVVPVRLVKKIQRGEYICGRGRVAEGQHGGREAHTGVRWPLPVGWLPGGGT